MCRSITGYPTKHFRSKESSHRKSIGLRRFSFSSVGHCFRAFFKNRTVGKWSSMKGWRLVVVGFKVSEEECLGTDRYLSGHSVNHRVNVHPSSYRSKYRYITGVQFVVIKLSSL